MQTLTVNFLYLNTCLTMSVQVSSSRTLDTTDRHRMFSSYTAGFSFISSVKRRVPLARVPGRDSNP
jgi:hypothetical protein